MKKSYLIALIIALIAILWIGSKAVIPNGLSDQDLIENTDETTPESKNPMKVSVKTVEPQNYIERISASGRSAASRNVTLRAEAEGQVVAVIANEGEAISTGQKILNVDVRERRERVREAQELVKQRQIEFEATQKLIKQGYASNVRLAQTQSAYESARALLKRAQIELEKTTIIAPFDGVLGKRYVDVGDYLRIGDEITDIIDLDPLEVTVFVNEKEVLQLHAGNDVELNFSSGEKRKGKVVYVSPVADESSRTFRVDIRFDNDMNTLPAGLTVQVNIAVANKKAYQIPSSILTLNDAGDVGIKIIADQNKVEFAPVTIIDDTRTLMWVTGLKGSVRVVTVGQDFVVPGQIVEAIESEQ